MQHLATRIVLFAIGVASCARTATAELPGSELSGSTLVTISGPTMGTSFSVKVPVEHLESTSLRQKVTAAIHVRLAEIDQRMSTYKEDSDVSQFNRHSANEWFPVANETAAVVQRSLEISQQTNGAFDITVGPLVRLWNFGPDTKTAEIPAADEVETIRAQVGYRHLQVRLDPPALMKQLDGVEVDLSAIAKGYAVDQVAMVLNDHGVFDFLVEIGGEIRASGMRSTKASDHSSSQWRVGIETPRSDARMVSEVIPLSNRSMASSGDYRNFFELNGKRYSHTIDPRTGRPVEHSFAAVSVLADDCVTADALATAMLVLGDDANELATSTKTSVLLFERQPAGSASQFSKIRLAGFPPAVPLPETSSSGYWQMLAASFIVFGVAVVAMAVGVIFSNRCVKGSCGGMEGLTDENGRPLCDGCSTPSVECTSDDPTPS